jgi:hypothetical protein
MRGQSTIFPAFGTCPGVILYLSPPKVQAVNRILYICTKVFQRSHRIQSKAFLFLSRALLTAYDGRMGTVKQNFFLISNHMKT